jgi:hypothetical protein
MFEALGAKSVVSAPCFPASPGRESLPGGVWELQTGLKAARNSAADALINYKNMAWQTLSLQFKQAVDGGYRYLDRCGEFMLDAEAKLNCVPGEIKPIGAKLEIPESGVRIGCDSNLLDVIQELPNGGTKYFVDLCKSLADLTAHHFNPKGIARNGFTWKSYWPFANPDDMLQASLKFNANFSTELGKFIGMVPSQQGLDHWFTSGSKDFHLNLQPSTFERINISKQAASVQATKGTKSLIDRRNKFADRVGAFVSHALILDLDLTEDDPPKQAQLDKHFGELEQVTHKLRDFFTIK